MVGIVNLPNKNGLNNLKRNNMKQKEEMHYLDAMDRDGWFTGETVSS